MMHHTPLNQRAFLQPPHLTTDFKLEDVTLLTTPTPYNRCQIRRRDPSYNPYTLQPPPNSMTRAFLQPLHLTTDVKFEDASLLTTPTPYNRLQIR